MKQITQKDVFKEILKFYPEYDVESLQKESELEINAYLLDIIDRFKDALHKRT